MSCSMTQHSDVGEAEPAAPRSRVKHSFTELPIQNMDVDESQAKIKTSRSAKYVSMGRGI